MAKMLKISIDLTKVGELARANHGSISKSQKNGKQYLNATIWINDQQDQYGNIGSLSVWDKNSNQTTYIGNLKEQQQTAPAAPVAPIAPANDTNLPF